MVDCYCGKKGMNEKQAKTHLKNNVGFEHCLGYRYKLISVIRPTKRPADSPKAGSRILRRNGN